MQIFSFVVVVLQRFSAATRRRLETEQNNFIGGTRISLGGTQGKNMNNFALLYYDCVIFNCVVMTLYYCWHFLFEIINMFSLNHKLRELWAKPPPLKNFGFLG